MLYIWKQDQPANNDYYKDFAALKADTKAHKDWEINTKTTNNKDILSWSCFQIQSIYNTKQMIITIVNMIT